MSATTTPKPTAYENKWQEIIAILSHGEPVTIRGYRRSSVIKGLTDAKLALSAEGKRGWKNGIDTKQLDDGAIKVSPRKWPFRKLTDEQRQALEQFASSDMLGIFMAGLAVMDVEQTLQELSAKYGVELRGEYAVHHLPDEVTDRACWVLKGGV